MIVTMKAVKEKCDFCSTKMWVYDCEIQTNDRKQIARFNTCFRDLDRVKRGLTTAVGREAGHDYPLLEYFVESVNIEDLDAKLSDLYSNGEGRLNDKRLRQLVEYIVGEILQAPPRCPTCGAPEDQPHGSDCPDSAED